MPDQISLAKRVGFIPPIPSQGYINLFIGTDGELKMIDSEGNISGAEGAVDVGSITGIEDLEFAEDGLLSGALGDARYATVAQGDLADTAVQSVSAGGGIAVTGTTEATVALSTDAQASLALANTALQQAGGTVTGDLTLGDVTVTGDFAHTGEGGITTESLAVLGASTLTGNITLNGTANTAPSQVFGANNILTGSLGDARYGNIIVKTKATDESRVSTTAVSADAELFFAYTAGTWEVDIYAMTNYNIGASGGIRAKVVTVGGAGGMRGVQNLTEMDSDVTPPKGCHPFWEIGWEKGDLVYTACFVLSATGSGTCTLHWAQNTVHATPTTIIAGATLIARKIA